jgi:desulfoferrodoxin-like iron-binding protein
MNIFKCSICGHIAFDNAPVECPVCGLPIENFNWDPEAIKTPQDPDNLNETEKKHIPVVSVSTKCDLIPGNGCVDVIVKVGALEHVMESEHFITFIDFYIDKRYLSRVHFTYKRLHPSASVCLHVEQGTLSVIEHCNVHGSWMTKVNIKKSAVP